MSKIKTIMNHLYLNKTASKKVMTGRQFVVAAAKLADVYTRATPYMFKLKVILNLNKLIYRGGESH